MLISEFTNRDDVLASVIKELNGVGIKIRSEKQKQSNVREIKFCRLNSLKNFVIFLEKASQ